MICVLPKNAAAETQNLRRTRPSTQSLADCSLHNIASHTPACRCSGGIDVNIGNVTGELCAQEFKAIGARAAPTRIKQILHPLLVCTAIRSALDSDPRRQNPSHATPASACARVLSGAAARPCTESADVNPSSGCGGTDASIPDSGRRRRRTGEVEQVEVAARCSSICSAAEASIDLRI
jgi:hypothetical protein